MSAYTPPEPPEGLGDVGRARWESVVGQYRLTPAELVVLGDIARADDRIAELDAARRADPGLIALGSQGQPVTHPLIAELRYLEAQRSTLALRLKLPDDPTVQAAPKPSRFSADALRSERARRAANIRWGNLSSAS